MPHRLSVAALLRQTQGHSLAEVVVATSLVVTVLVPLSGLAIYLLTAAQNEPHLVALALGQQAMEQTLHARAYEPQTAWLDDDRWRVRKMIAQTGNQVTIRIQVFRRHRPQPLIDLMTIRLIH